MSTLSFKLDAFEGPLDLLLHLISKHKLNIYDIEISLLLDQYMEYIDSIDEQDFDTAGDFLEMAARLVYIKTYSLLPQAQEAEELKKELEGNLLEYSVCKEAARNLRAICVYGEVFVRPPEKLPVNKTFTGNIDPQKLLDAYMGMSAKARSMRPIKAEQFSPIVSSRIVTVTSKIVFVLKKLYKTGFCSMNELYEGIKDKSARVATFLAVLELTKSGRILLNDDNTEITFNRESKRRHLKGKSAVAFESAENTEEKTADTETLISEEKISSEPALDSVDASDDIENVTNDSEAYDTYSVEKEPAYIETSVSIPVREKYVTERRGGDVSLALSDNATTSVFSDQLSVQGENFSKTGESEESDEVCEPDKQEFISADNIDLTKFKINRFSRRYHWGFPEFTGNCWIYRRERL